MLSRNFRLQRVGDVNWINQNYNFKTIATSIDELVILNVERDNPDLHQFCKDVRLLFEGCFMPLALGGGLRTMEHIELMMDNGADKVVLNLPLFDNPTLVRSVCERYGSQCVIASIDFKQKEDGTYQVYTEGGTRPIDQPIEEVFRKIADLGVGEVYLNSIDADGTGNGYRLDILAHTDIVSHLPLILVGGAGNYLHLLSGLQSPSVDAVATANLFNFIGNGLPSAREKLLEEGCNLADWSKVQHHLWTQ